MSGAFVEDNLQFWRGTAAVAAAANDGKIRAHTVALLCSVLLGSLLLARTVGGTTALHNTAFELGAPEYARVRPSARCTPLHCSQSRGVILAASRCHWPNRIAVCCGGLSVGASQACPRRSVRLAGLLSMRRRCSLSSKSRAS